MKQALAYIVSNLVDNSKDVVINEEESEGIINFTISVAKEDMGKVIGKEGRVIRAIRNVLKIPAIKQGKRINVSIADFS